MGPAPHRRRAPDTTPPPFPNGAAPPRAGLTPLVRWDREGPALPPGRPDGSPWPSVAVLVVERAGGADATLSSLAAQDYPALSVRGVRPGPDAIRLAAAHAEAEFVLVLESGDQVAPGALASLALAAGRLDADLVAGLRVLLGEGGVVEVDALEVDAVASAPREPFGDVLIRRALLLSPSAPGVPPRIARVARPVLLRPAADGSAEPRPTLAVAAVNDSGEAGGAGIAHRRIAEALRLGGHPVSMFRLNDVASPAAAEWTDAFPAVEAAVAAARPDLVLVGNLHGATRTTTLLSRLSAVAPVAAVLHDLFPLTGRCAHPGPCRRIETVGCDAACPTPEFYPQLAPPRIAAAFNEKRAVLGSGRVALLANSSWTEERARALGPPGTRIGRIDLPCLGQVFRPPADKAALRRRLGLPPDDVLILFGAVIADQPDKGGQDVVSALRTVARPGLGFVALGRIDDRRAFPLPGLVTPGPIADEALLAAWYGACDIHVTASRLETFGQTAVEAGLCGVPTVAYRLTGLVDAVIDGVSGVLVEPTPAALAAALNALAADPDRRARLGAWGRLALEARNSHAGTLLGLHDALRATGLAPNGTSGRRVRFAPDLLRAFAMSPDPVLGRGGTVARPPSRVTAAARRLKQRLWGRRQPLWMRLGLYGLHRLHAAASRRLGKS